MSHFNEHNLVSLQKKGLGSNTFERFSVSLCLLVTILFTVWALVIILARLQTMAIKASVVTNTILIRFAWIKAYFVINVTVSIICADSIITRRNTRFVVTFFSLLAMIISYATRLTFSVDTNFFLSTLRIVFTIWFANQVVATSKRSF